jgi:hypothetical protein
LSVGGSLESFKDESRYGLLLTRTCLRFVAGDYRIRSEQPYRAHKPCKRLVMLPYVQGFVGRLRMAEVAEVEKIDIRACESRRFERTASV